MTSDDFKENSHLLWASSSSRPDLGMTEEDDNLHELEFASPMVQSAGLYDSVCVELEV